MDILKLNGLLKDATTPERKIEILKAMVEAQASAIQNRDNMLRTQQIEIDRLKGQLELANTFTNSKKDEILKEQTLQISELEHKLKISKSNEKLYMTEWSNTIEVCNGLRDRVDYLKLEIEGMRLIKDITRLDRIPKPEPKVEPKAIEVKEISKPEPTPMIKSGPSYTIQNTYNIYGTYNRYGHLNEKV